MAIVPKWNTRSVEMSHEEDRIHAGFRPVKRLLEIAHVHPTQHDIWGPLDVPSKHHVSAPGGGRTWKFLEQILLLTAL